MWNIKEEKCSHGSTTYIEIPKHTVVSTHHPIINSRFQKINDFEYSRTKEIKVPALKCLECGEIIEIKHPMVASTASTNNYGAYSYGSNSVAIGCNAYSAGQNNIAIGYSAGYKSNYSTNYTTRSITDMGFLDDMKTALNEAERKQEKALKNYSDKQSKLDRINERVAALAGNIGGNTLDTLENEIDRIKQQYDDIVNKQKLSSSKMASAQQYAQQKYGNKLKSPPPPPPMPKARRVGGSKYGDNQSGYYREEPLTPVNGTEYVRVMFRGVEVEEKTFDDIKYLDFTFYKPVGQEDSRLNILESGDVIKWEQAGSVFNKVKAIKAIRISEEDLEKARKEL